MAKAERVREVASRSHNRVLVVVIGRAARAINVSHPGELAPVTGQFMADEPITDGPGLAGGGPQLRNPPAPTCPRARDVTRPPVVVASMLRSGTVRLRG
jgi:hypothetical protein